MGGSWYDTGFGGIDNELKRQEELYGPKRFWVPKGKTSNAVWVSDDPFGKSGLTE